MADSHVKKPNTQTQGNLGWKIINQPFVIWSLSALLISFLGAYYSVSSQCNMDASNYYMKAASLLQELRGRTLELDAILISRIGQQTLSPNDISDISDEVKLVLLGQRGFQTPEFKEHRWNEVMRAFNAAYRRIKPDGDLLKYVREKTQEELDRTFKDSPIEKPPISSNVADVMELLSGKTYEFLLQKSNKFQSERLGYLSESLLQSDKATLAFYDKMFSNALPQNQCSFPNAVSTPNCNSDA